LLEITREHPEYGYRRTSIELKARGFHVNHKVIERLHSSWALSVLKRVKYPKGSSIQVLLKEAGPKVNLMSSLEENSDFEVLYTDFTEIRLLTTEVNLWLGMLLEKVLIQIWRLGPGGKQSRHSKD